MATENLIPHHGIARLYNGFFSAEESLEFARKLRDEVSWKQEPITMFGKQIMQPRLTCWMGDQGINYSYSGIKMEGVGWTPMLLSIKAKIEPVAGVKFTGALLNYYRDGKDSMGWHRDNEKELGHHPVIGSVSFGGTRLFEFRDYHTKRERVSLSLSDGSLLVMAGETQDYWQHRVPRQSTPALPRINITFRVI